MIGEIVFRVTKRIVDNDDDRVKEFNINRFLIIGVMAVIAMTLYFKYDIKTIIAYGGVGVFLISIGIIDYYTRYVYLKMAILGIIYAFIFGLNIYGIKYIIYILTISIFIIILAYFTGKWYGDIEAALIVALTLGIDGLAITFFVVGLISIVVALFKRKLHCIVPVCPMIAIGYLVSILLL